MSTSAYDAIPLATMSFVDHGEKLLVLKSAWLSMLVPDWSLFGNRKEGIHSTVYVLCATVHGVLGWSCSVVTASDEHAEIVMDFDAPAKKWKFVTVTDGNLDEWSCNEVKPLCPALALAVLPKSSKCGCMRMVCSKQGGGASLLRFAARSGLRGLIVALLRRLYRFLEVPHKGALPSTEANLAYGLVKHLFPEKSHDEINAIVALRSARRGSAVEVTSGSNDVDDVAADFGSDEEAVIRKDLTYIVPVKKSSSAGIAGKPGGGGRKEPSQPVKKSIDFEHELSVEYARSFMPKVAGAPIAKDTRLHMKWSVSYPTEAPPHSATKAIGLVGDHEALRYCLRWVWGKHESATGEACPGDLKDLARLPVHEVCRRNPGVGMLSKACARLVPSVPVLSSLHPSLVCMSCAQLVGDGCVCSAWLKL